MTFGNVLQNDRDSSLPLFLQNNDHFKVDLLLNIELSHFSKNVDYILCLILYFFLIDIKYLWLKTNAKMYCELLSHKNGDVSLLAISIHLQLEKT